MKDKKVFLSAFGLNEMGVIDFPKKISNVKLARIEWGEYQGCAFCFPHGFEVTNSTWKKNRRNWKYKRKKQFHSSKHIA